MTLADLGGGARSVPPPVPNSFIFMQFSVKFGRIIGWRPYLGSCGPPSGRSWIRHCMSIFASHITLNEDQKICEVWLRSTSFWKICEYRTSFGLLEKYQHRPPLPNIKYNCAVLFFTARIRRMTGGYVFTGVCLFNFWGGVPPSPLTGGTPSFPMGGTPFPGLDEGGTPCPNLGRGYPPPSGPGKGVPPPLPGPGKGVSPRPDLSLDRRGGLPPTGTAQRVLATRLQICFFQIYFLINHHCKT